MKLIPTSTDAIALTCASILGLGIFVAGLCDVLDYFIVKALLFLGFGTLFVFAIINMIKNETKKNHPEDNPQDDSH